MECTICYDKHSLFTKCNRCVYKWCNRCDKNILVCPYCRYDFDRIQPQQPNRFIMFILQVIFMLFFLYIQIRIQMFFDIYFVN